MSGAKRSACRLPLICNIHSSGYVSTQPLALPSIEDEGARAFQIGRRVSTYRPYGFAFCPYKPGSTMHDNWICGYVKIFDAVSRS